MKTLTFLSSSIALALICGSCTSDKESDTVAVTQQLYPKPVVKLGVSLHVLSSTVTNAKAEGLSQATVSVKQFGKTFSGTTDASGIVTFADLVEGEVSYYVSADGHSKINGSFFLSYDGDLQIRGVNGNSTSASSVTIDGTASSNRTLGIELPRLGATVSGHVMADLDGNGPLLTLPLSQVGSVVLKITDNSGSTRTDIEPNTYMTTIGANGLFTLSGLPENVSYRLYAKGVEATIAASGNEPQHKRTLNFPSTVRTTPEVNRVSNLGIISLIQE